MRIEIIRTARVSIARKKNIVDHIHCYLIKENKIFIVCHT